MMKHLHVISAVATLLLFTSSVLLVTGMDLNGHRLGGRPLIGGGGGRFRTAYGADEGGASLTSSGGASATMMGLNLLSFGCVSNGPDCGPQFQLAIDAAISQGRALLVPAGQYNINQTLTIPMTAGSRTAFRMKGEGKYLSKIVVSPQVYHLGSLFNVSWDTVDHETNNVEISDVFLDASSKADYAFYAPGLCRSYFNLVFFTGALKSGCLHGGWIDVFSQCSFNGNHKAGLEMTIDNNNVVVEGCSFEGNPGMGISIHGGSQISIVNTVIEGNGGVAIWADGVSGLAIRSSYFEFNQYNLGPATVPYGPPGNPHGGNLTFFADVVLSGTIHDGTKVLGGANPCVGVELVGNTFCPHGSQRIGFLDVPTVAFLLASVTGGTMSDNRMACYNEGTSLFLMSTSSFFNVQDMTIGGNGQLGTNAQRFPTNLQLHNHNASFSSGRSITGIHMDFVKNGLLPGIGKRGFTFPLGNHPSSPGSYWNGLLAEDASSTHEMLFQHGAASRLQMNDSAIVSMSFAEKGATKIYGQWFTPILDETLDRLPVKSVLWVKALSLETVFTLVLYPGGGAPPQRSSDWYAAPSDGWIPISIGGLLVVPPGGQTAEMASGIGIQIVNDNTDNIPQVAIGGWGPNLAPVGLNLDTDFYNPTV